MSRTNMSKNIYGENFFIHVPFICFKIIAPLFEVVPFLFS